MLSTPHPPHPTLGFWIRLFWLLNPWLLKIVVVESGVLVVESGFAGCWNRLFWLLKPWLLNPAVLVVESGFFGCWIRLCWLLKPWLLNVLVCWFRLCWLLKLWLSNPSLWLLNPAFWLLNLSCWIRVGCWIRFCSPLESWCQHHELPKHRLAACKQLDLLLSPGRTWLFSCWLSSQAQCSG